MRWQPICDSALALCTTRWSPSCGRMGGRYVLAVVTFAHKPTIVGRRVILRPMVASDADDVWADLHDAEGIRMTGTHATFGRDQIDSWCATRGGKADRLDLAVIDRESGVWAGEVVVNDWDGDNRSCGFRISLGPAGRGRGLGREAMTLIVDHVFDVIDDPPVNRMALEVYEFNKPAMAVYDKVGFRREGVLRQALRWGDAFHDAVVMSILRSDRVT
jgi:RimJ/RimL family protein N-acetyltransferase